MLVNHRLLFFFYLKDFIAIHQNCSVKLSYGHHFSVGHRRCINNPIWFIKFKLFHLSKLKKSEKCVILYRSLLILFDRMANFGGFYKVNNATESFSWQTCRQNWFYKLEIDFLESQFSKSPSVWQKFQIVVQGYSACIHFESITLKLIQYEHLNIRNVLNWRLNASDLTKCKIAYKTFQKQNSHVNAREFVTNGCRVFNNFWFNIDHLIQFVNWLGMSLKFIRTISSSCTKNSWKFQRMKLIDEILRSYCGKEFHNLTCKYRRRYILIYKLETERTFII